MADKQTRKQPVEVAAVKPVAKPTPAPVVVVLTDDQKRTALDHARRELDGSIGPVSSDPNLGARLDAIDRESALLNKKRQDEDTKPKATRS